MKPNGGTPVFYVPMRRQHFLMCLAQVSAGFSLGGYLAEALTLTPSMSQGPFYPLPKNIPLDKDNDLVVMNDSLTRAIGKITYLSGKVLDRNGQPIRGALVELWHADSAGNYTFSSSSTRNPASDPNFAGFGQYLTGSDGAYGFRTVKAGLYPGRTRHFHLGVTIPGQLRRFATQLYWNEAPRREDGTPWATTNENDGVLRAISDNEQRASVILDFAPVPGSSLGEEQGYYDFVMGQTPVEPVYPGGGGLVIAGEAVQSGGGQRYRLRVPAYAGYSYELYGNPTLGAMAWASLPFSLTQDGDVDRNIHTVTADGVLELFVEAKSFKSFYYVSFRVPGANTGTP